MEHFSFIFIICYSYPNDDLRAHVRRQGQLAALLEVNANRVNPWKPSGELEQTRPGPLSAV